ncbi:Cys-Gln thioester bond-forming surface protein [Streptomyces fenghuangensis]|uniref:Cys-Gln thioester bond-forming surface protein n=1 Tax=Streptomyces sp. ICN903 TaxID=2964654 RepID=UPI001EDA9EF2|nr:Cys-Gln thioester bond-forming surface protein [Streptomyces sp. ICN903]MCG3043130.1 Cys-Gln thioester bond-forming surface protein [Streptomyces sp. ICN903]
MISVRGRGPARFAAAAIATGMLAVGAIAGAGTAVADENNQQGGVLATLPKAGVTIGSGVKILNGPNPGNTAAGLFELQVEGGGTLKTYCIDVGRGTVAGAKYREASWDESTLHNNENAGKILWILQNSYPQVNDLTALASKAGEGVSLTEKTAAAGTQIAIWHFSDNVKVDADDDNADKLAEYLIREAQNLAEPKASLTLEPSAVSGKAGEKLGPVTVRTNAQTVNVAPGAEAANAGVTVVDKDGNAVTTAKEGDQLFFDVPKGTEPGTASLTAQANTEVAVGRAFTSVDPKNPSQTQILAGSSSSSVTANATANWANEGPIPAVTAEKNCVKGGVDVTATNEGDEPFSFSLAGKEYEIPAGGSETVTVPVQEDQEYNITITGPNGFKETFTGTLDCETETTTGGNGGGEEESPKPSTEPSPATVGGDTGDTGDTDGNLAETGSSSNTPIIAGVALALVVLGGAAVFFLRKKKPATAGSDD